MRCFYVIWHYAFGPSSMSLGGCKVLTFPGPFDLAEAHRQIASDEGGEPVIIGSWQEIDKGQANRMADYFREAIAYRQRKESKGKKPVLKLEPGGRPDTEYYSAEPIAKPVCPFGCEPDSVLCKVEHLDNQGGSV